MLIHIAVLLCAIAQIFQALSILSLNEKMERIKAHNAEIIGHAEKALDVAYNVIKTADEAIETDRELNNTLVQSLKTMMEAHEDAHG